MCGCLSLAPYWGPSLACNPGTGHDSHRQAFGLQAGAQSSEPHQPGLSFYFQINTYLAQHPHTYYISTHILQIKKRQNIVVLQSWNLGSNWIVWNRENSLCRTDPHRCGHFRVFQQEIYGLLHYPDKRKEGGGPVPPTCPQPNSQGPTLFLPMP